MKPFEYERYDPSGTPMYTISPTETDPIRSRMESWFWAPEPPPSNAVTLPSIVDTCDGVVDRYITTGAIV